MKNWKILLYCLTFVLLFFSLVCLSQVSAAEKQWGIIAVTDGHGRVDLFWMARPDLWPVNGWRLKEIPSGATVVKSLLPGAAEVENDLTIDERAAIADKVFKIVVSKDKELKIKAGSFLLFENFHDFQRLKAMGLGWTLHNVAPGKHQYRLIGLDENGHAKGPTLESDILDTSRPSPALVMPTALRAEPGKNGLSLFWTIKQEKSSLAMLTSYSVERIDEEGNTTNMTPSPISISEQKEAEKPAFIDQQPPPEQKLTYRVSTRDIFGRHSKPAEISIFNPDPQALWPPNGLTVEGRKNKIKLSWEKNQNPFTAGYVIERSRNMNRRYQPLNVKPIPTSQLEFIDKEDLIPGLTYYYRIRSVNSRGRVGAPSFSVTGIPQTGGRPKPPQKFQAQVKPTRVYLSWEPMAMPVAGYIVEKRPKGAKKWRLLNGIPLTISSFADKIDLEDFGEFSYRVIAVAFDNKKSKPSKELNITLLGKPHIPPPYIQDIASNKGVVTLKFMKSAPVERTAKFLVIRGISRRDKKGLIISDLISGDKTKFEDKRVTPGEDYWYQLLAIGKDKRRSEPSNKLYIKVGAPDIPQPGKPDVTFKPKPFPHIVIDFKEPPRQLLASIHRRENEKGPWVTVADNIRNSTQFIDANPPRSGRVQYRVLYSAENGKTGVPSKTRILSVDG